MMDTVDCFLPQGVVQAKIDQTYPFQWGVWCPMDGGKVITAKNKETALLTMKDHGDILIMRLGTSWHYVIGEVSEAGVYASPQSIEEGEEWA